MARYDQPGFPDQVPGYPPRNSHEYGTAQGSDGPNIADPAGFDLGSVPVSIPGASSIPPIPRVTVNSDDTQVPGQNPTREPFTGVANDAAVTFPGPGSPSSHVVTPSHPNSNGVNRD